MPLLLKRDSIRLLAASCESLRLALIGLSTPATRDQPQADAALAPIVGLVGTAAELAVSAIVVQVSGTKAVMRTATAYKTGREVLADFRGLLKEAAPPQFLVEQVPDPTAHIEKLDEFARKLLLLTTVRANGLHGGYGASRPVALSLAENVSGFLTQLSTSSRLRPYLRNAPSVPEPRIERTAIVEDLARRLDQSDELRESGQLLSTLYLVLPETPDDEPSWLEAFDRLTVSPQEQDISLLITTLGDAVPAGLIRVPPSIAGTPVVVRPSDPQALPIAPQFLSRSFNTMSEQWYADVSNANGRLATGIVDLPPWLAVVEAFVLGLDQVGVLESDGMMIPHSVWPFVASSLSVNGTPGPYWFLVQHSRDLPQLKALVNQAALQGSGYLRSRQEEFNVGIDALIDGGEIDGSIPYVEDLVSRRLKSETARADLASALERNRGTERALNEDMEPTLSEISQQTSSVSSLLVPLALAQGEPLGNVAKLYWARTLAEAAVQEDDLPGVLAVLQQEDLKVAHTAARKAIRSIDFQVNGPKPSLAPG